MQKKSKKVKKLKDPFADREAQKYETPIPSREFILDYLAERGCPVTYLQLQDELGLTSETTQEALRRRLIAMTRDGQLLKNRKGAYGPLEKMELISGRVTGHKDGFGFLVPEDGKDDLFLSPRQMRQVFHGDKALARVASIDSRGRREGIIVEVLERNTQQLVGRFFKEAGANFVESSNQRITQTILIPPEETKQAENGQIVVIAIITQPASNARPIGKVIEILGDHMAPGMEINVALRNHDLPFVWPDEALLEAGRFEAYVQEEAIEGRVDLRHLPFVTIDGEDAKDFDDAVFVSVNKGGGFTLYVAIADVSYYVKPKTSLDKEAYKRGNSVYFPGRVIPMLPEALSNNLCSLNPNVDRLAVVCEMSIHASGRIMQHQFLEAVIQSKRRLTYKQVHTMMEKNDSLMRSQFADVVPHLSDLYDLFRILHKARQGRGAIDFDLPETKIVFGKNRKIKQIIPYERFNSHRVIEECMLCANISAAKFLQKNNQPGLYRVHLGPNEEKLNDLRRFLQEMALKMPGHREPTPKDYAHLLRVVKDRADAHMIQTVLLRSMSQAVYSPTNKGHFGLAYDAYTHFTSPIRRYPDLIVHRAIKNVLSKKKQSFETNELEQMGEHCSKTERRADDATNEAIDWLKCEYMMNKIGHTFSGIISGVTGFGLFVELQEVYVEGLIHISTLPEDYYQFEASKHLLQGERSGRRFRLGDSIEIQVVRVDLDQRQIDFLLKESAEAPPRTKKSRLASRRKVRKKKNK